MSFIPKKKKKKSNIIQIIKLVGFHSGPSRKETGLL